MIKTWVEDGKTWAATADLKHWDRNPRDITNQAFAELKDSLKKGVLHNLVINQDGIVLGGNRRYDAFVEMKHEKIWVEVAQTNTLKDMFDVAMRSNTSSGFYVEEKLSKLAVELKLSPVELKGYRIQLGEAKPLDLLINGPDFDEGNEDDQGNLDQTQKKEIECPHCGEVFTL